ncbi:hypothetical protein NBY09_02220 [Elizabethkingia anophelis]|uniref:hypothetical protein n=1 Tax=Elizabethkingia anophelis TaxID=1117645 RepID=UPI00235050F0|nr:hypothetical protein [Elizabethkingia anophelis]MDC8024997.1 hypothetical protein [Elizabethkingia anophelis]
MKSIWKAIYGNSEIRIENTWFNGEKLYVNDVLQDEQINWFPNNIRLTGHLIQNGEKIPIKANLYSSLCLIECSLFIMMKKLKHIKYNKKCFRNYGSIMYILLY